jgi:ABC-2 type transport system permease protein
VTVGAPAATPASVPQVVGPSALGGDLRRFVYLSLTLALTDFKLRFYGSVMGYLWQLMRPLLLFGVLYGFFTQIVKIGDIVPHYPVLLLANIVLFTFFAEATGQVTCVVDRESLVRKIRFPRMAIPVSVTLVALFNFVLNAMIVLVFALASNVTPRWTWLLAPLLLLPLVLMAVGASMFLSALYVRFRDIKPMWEVTLQMLFYATPILYALETISVADWIKRAIVLVNPLATIIQQFRHWVIDPTAPTAAAMAGGAGWLLIPATLAFGIFVLGFRVFDREAPRIAEDL